MCGRPTTSRFTCDINAVEKLANAAQEHEQANDQSAATGLTSKSGSMHLEHEPQFISSRPLHPLLVNM